MCRAPCVLRGGRNIVVQQRCTLGHSDYASFLQWLKRSTRYNSSFFDANQLVSSDIRLGSMVEIGWTPNRLLRLEYLDGSRFRVVKSCNSKLLVGDVFITGCFIKGRPLFLGPRDGIYGRGHTLQVAGQVGCSLCLRRHGTAP